jgi:putative transposase
MPNHVHLIMVSATTDGLSRALGETHRQCTGLVNARARWTGHLFQWRFASVGSDEEHLMPAAHYATLDPVRARLVRRPQGWALDRRDDALVTVAPLLQRFGSVATLIDLEPEAAAPARLRAAETTGRPLGSDDLMGRLESIVHRRLRSGHPAASPTRRQRAVTGHAASINSMAVVCPGVNRSMIAIGALASTNSG